MTPPAFEGDSGPGCASGRLKASEPPVGDGVVGHNLSVPKPLWSSESKTETEA